MAALRSIKSRKMAFSWFDRAFHTYTFASKSRACLAYMALISTAREDEICRMSVSGLAETVGIGETAMRQGLNDLEKCGLISIDRRVVRGTGQIANSYSLLDFQIFRGEKK